MVRLERPLPRRSGRSPIEPLVPKWGSTSIPRNPGDPTLSEEARLVGWEAFDEETAEARAALSSDGERESVERLDPGIMSAIQDRLIGAIHEAGVMVEANPSSNLVTGAVARLSDHPFFRYRDALDGQIIVSINTDDPGVFGTRIDVEFGLMFEALKDGFGRTQALAMLESARQLGFDYAFRGAERPEGEDRPTA